MWDFSRCCTLLSWFPRHSCWCSWRRASADSRASQYWLIGCMNDLASLWIDSTLENKHLTCPLSSEGEKLYFFVETTNLILWISMNIFIWVQYLNWELHILRNPRHSSFVGCCSYLLRTLFLVEVSSGKFLPVSQSQKAGTARHSRLMKRRSLTCTTWGLTIPGHTDCSTIRLHG